MHILNYRIYNYKIYDKRSLLRMICCSQLTGVNGISEVLETERKCMVKIVTVLAFWNYLIRREERNMEKPMNPLIKAIFNFQTVILF